MCFSSSKCVRVRATIFFSLFTLSVRLFKPLSLHHFLPPQPSPPLLFFFSVLFAFQQRYSSLFFWRGFSSSPSLSPFLFSPRNSSWWWRPSGSSSRVVPYFLAYCSSPSSQSMCRCAPTTAPVTTQKKEEKKTPTIREKLGGSNGCRLLVSHSVTRQPSVRLSQSVSRRWRLQLAAFTYFLSACRRFVYLCAEHQRGLVAVCPFVESSEERLFVSVLVVFRVLCRAVDFWLFLSFILPVGWIVVVVFSNRGGFIQTCLPGKERKNEITTLFK